MKWIKHVRESHDCNEPSIPDWIDINNKKNRNNSELTDSHKMLSEAKEKREIEEKVKHQLLEKYESTLYEEEEEILRIRENIKKEGGKSECAICLDRLPNAVCFPCGHAMFCMICVEPLTNCPMCRAEITQKKKIYT